MSLMLSATETQFQEAVVEAAQVHGWIVAHFRPAKTEKGWRTPVAADGKGFPDLVLAHPQRGVLFRELKSEKGKVSPEQQVWIDTLTAGGADAGFWRPRDWDDIERVLRGRP